MNNPQDMIDTVPLLELRDIRQSYPQGTISLDVLVDASLTVRAGGNEGSCRPIWIWQIDVVEYCRLA